MTFDMSYSHEKYSEVCKYILAENPKENMGKLIIKGFLLYL